MATRRLPTSLDQVRETALRIAEATESPSLRVRLWHDVLAAPHDAPHVVEATKALDHSRWVRLLAAEQHDDGGWGALHVLTYPTTQQIPSTEAAVDRAVALGLPRSHPILQRAAIYLRSILDGRIAIPADYSYHPATRIASVIPGSKLAALAPGDPCLEPLRNLWTRILARAVHGGSYDEAAERQAHGAFAGVPDGSPTWLMFGRYHDGRHLCKYRMAVLASEPDGLNPGLERILLRTACEAGCGLSYFHVPLTKPPGQHASKVNAWLASWELLSGFRFWRDFASDAMVWLCSQRGPDGFWDFGPRPTPMLFVPWLAPLSESWRPKMARKHDWTARVLLLLNAYLGHKRVPLTHAFDAASAGPRFATECGGKDQRRSILGEGWRDHASHPLDGEARERTRPAAEPRCG